MASTYSELKLELITTGEQSGTWGETTNTNLGTALGEAITGSADVTFSSADVNLTLTDTNASQVARNLRLNITGTLGASRYLYLSTGCNIEKFYLVNNGSAYAVTVQNKIAGTPSGSTVTVPAGKSMLIYNTGTNIVDAATHFTAVTLTSPLAVTSGGTGATTSTGSGAVVLGTGPTISSPTVSNGTFSSPTLTTPVLGTPASGDFSSGTFTWPTFNQSTTGNALTATSATTATNLAGGLAFKIPYQTSAGTTSFVGVPTDNTYLKYNTAGGFTWATIGGGTAFALTMNNSGTGDVSGTTFDGNAAKTISYNTIGASPLAGSTSITTLGTIATGTWNGTAIGAGYGGTGYTSYTTGDMLYGNGPAFVKLSAVATGNALISGGVNTAPAWGKIGLTTHVSGTLPVANGGTGVTTSTGSGNVVLSTSPTLVTPALGTPTSGNLSNCTFPTFNQNTTGSAGSVANALTFGTGLTGTASTFNGSAAVTVNATGTVINSQIASYTLVAADAGKTISTKAGVTVPASVLAAGNIVTIYNNGGGTSITLTQGSGLSMQWAGQGTASTGNRTLDVYGMATIVYLSATTAVITGNGLS
jgi:hypothetical protein